MSAERPLNDAEEAVWRALLRLVFALPRTLEADLLRATGLTMTEMIVLVSLADAPEGALRMSELAGVAALSPSRITRLVADLQGRGLVEKRLCVDDGRGHIARLTKTGRSAVRRSYPGRLRNAREHVLDHIHPSELVGLGRVLERIVEGVGRTSD